MPFGAEETAGIDCRLTLKWGFTLPQLRNQVLAIQANRFVPILSLLIVAGISWPVCVAQRPSVRLTVNGVAVEGTPAAWSDTRLLLLGRDGSLHDIESRDVQQYEVLSTEFQPMTQREMRGQLLRRVWSCIRSVWNQYVLGSASHGTKRLVGAAVRTALSIIYAPFQCAWNAYSAPEFPLVAIAFKSRSEFVNYANQTGVQVPGGVVGFYSMLTNRIMLYDVAANSSRGSDSSRNAATILHEATHQIAFNSGVHSRYAAPPRWLAEGLATMFEAPGLWDPVHYPRLEDRISTDRCAACVKYLKTNGQPNQLAQFISQSDEQFTKDPAAAYAQAWAFSFFLSEKEPARYVQYLAATAARQPFHKYSEVERIQEFTRVFGTDFGLLDARFHRFIGQLGR